MTKHTSTIRLAEKPYKMIRWLTENYKYEVCAFGIGEVVDGEMYIEKLVFPKQRVNSVHVEFDPADWGSLFPQMEGDEMDRIIFYWHKHPGCPAASSDDEANTFDTLMDENAGRKIFGFLQTAISGNTFKYEARIEIRDPVIATIMTVDLVTDEDFAIEEECQSMIKKYCIEPAPYVAPKNSYITNLYKGLEGKGSKAEPVTARTGPTVNDLLLTEGDVCNVLRHAGDLYIVVIKNLANWIEDEVAEFMHKKMVDTYHKDTTFITGCVVFKCIGHKKELKQVAKQLRQYIVEFNMGVDSEYRDVDDLNIQNESALEELLETKK